MQLLYPDDNASLACACGVVYVSMPVCHTSRVLNSPVRMRLLVSARASRGIYVHFTINIWVDKQARDMNPLGYLFFEQLSNDEQSISSSCGGIKTRGRSGREL